MKYLIHFYFLFFISYLSAEANWDYVVADFQARPSNYKHTVISGGASNLNYHVTVDGQEYCIRIAPKNSKAIYADLEIEYQVLKLLAKLNVSAQPVYFNKENGVLVTQFIPHDQANISLQDAAMQTRLFQMLHKIEAENLEITRTFSPYPDVMTIVEKSHQFGATSFSKDFYETLLPKLQQIDIVLKKNGKKTLCHLDLHSKNLLQKEEKLWIVDWEYAAMSHPYLVLASMASIERWDDAQMKQQLETYFIAKGTTPPEETDFHTLYLYRIVADIFWTAWNHVQAHISPIQRPYTEWEELFYKAALERIQSEQFQQAMNALS